MRKFGAILGVFGVYYLADALYLWLLKGDPWALKSLLAGIVFIFAWWRQRPAASR